MNRIKVPRLKRVDPLKPGRHTRRRQAAARPAVPAAPSAPVRSPRPTGQSRLDDEYGLDYQTARLRAANPPVRSSAKHRPGARAELGSRTPSMPRRQTAIASDKHRGIAAPAERNYPRQKNPIRQRQSDTPARKQLEARQPLAGQPKHHPLSGELARKPTVGKGRAQRPAARLRDPHADPQHKRPVESGQRHPELSGRSFAGRFFA